jgi:ribosomal-protein-alanine N-acetyltransferase
MIFIPTDRLVIHDHLRTDLAAMYGVFGNRDVMYFLPDLFCPTVRTMRNNLREAILEQHRRDRSKFFFAVIDRASGKYLGETGYTIVERSCDGHRAHLGYFFAGEHWGRGIATEAVRAVFGFAFGEGEIIKMSTGCIAENVASERVMGKCGFSREAVFRRHVFHDGVWMDRVEYGLLRDEWMARTSDARTERR